MNEHDTTTRPRRPYTYVWRLVQSGDNVELLQHGISIAIFYDAVAAMKFVMGEAG